MQCHIKWGIYHQLLEVRVFFHGNFFNMDEFSLLDNHGTDAGGRRGPGRPQNAVRTEQITLSLPPQQRDLLESLTLTGYFGRNLVETATMLLWEAIQKSAYERVEKSRALQREMEALRAERDKRKLKKIAAVLDEP